jgi:hypothetical protein
VVSFAYHPQHHCVSPDFVCDPKRIVSRNALLLGKMPE